MGKVLFIPLSVGLGLAAGVVGNRIFEQVWGLIDEEEPPDAKHRDIPWAKLLLAGALQGAIFRVTRVVADRGLRTGFFSLTGSWPGEDKPDPE